MTELDKLEQYLKERNRIYQRVDSDYTTDSAGHMASREIHQIVAYKYGKYSWDAICHPGSYGYEDGLLEIMGEISQKKRDVEGYLTAADVIDRIELTERARAGC